jgi:hypothetical protein
MASPIGDPGPAADHDRASPPRRTPESRTARQGLWALSLLGICLAVALIILTGNGGAAANVPRALQIGTHSVVIYHGATPPKPTTAISDASTTTEPTTTIVTTATFPTTTAVTRVHATTTTQLTASVTIVRHKSRVTEKDDGGESDDSAPVGLDN